MIEVQGGYSVLKKDIFDNLSFSTGIMKLDSVQPKRLVDFLNSHDSFHLEELQNLIYKVYDDLKLNIPVSHSCSCYTVLQKMILLILKARQRIALIA